ncbi:MAG TPA: Ig-like domain-containing protein [Pseudomonadales bacterium]|nr:Ig-like domain-containing protein [Pseudomonadales bacterium]
MRIPISSTRLVLLFLISLLAACGGSGGGGTTPTPTVASVTVSPATATINVGATQQLTATAKDSSGATISGASIAYSSSDTAIATVSTGGLVTGVAAGSATITATSSGKSGTATITVNTPAPTVATVTLSPSAVTLTAGNTQQLTATAKDASNATISGATFTYASSDTTVATVDSSGLVTAVAAGTATITATSGGVDGTATITVNAATAVTGTAATGAPIANTAITLVDSAGATSTATTGADGSFTIDTSGLTPPFMLQITKADTTKLYSVSADTSASGVINVDPLTDLIIRTWYSVQGANVDAAFADPGAAPPPSPAEVQIINNVVVQVVQLWLQNAGVDTTNLNLISTPFTADGSGVDSVLDKTTIDTSTNTVTVKDSPTSPTTTQTTTLTLNPTDSSIKVDTTTTSGPITSSSSTTLTVPTTSAQSTAFDEIQATFNAFADMINSKGSALTADDITPYLSTNLLDQGHSATIFADDLAGQLRGNTLSVTISKVTELDTTAGTAHAYFTATISQGGVSQQDIVDFYLDKSSGSWLISGDQRLAQISVDAEMRTNMGAFTGNDGPDINIDIEAPQNSLTSITANGGPFQNQNIPKSQNRIETYRPTPTTSIDVTYDAFYANTGPLSTLVPAGTDIALTLTPVTGSAETYHYPLNAFTNESIRITSPTGTALADANLGNPLSVTWTLPTTYAIAKVQLDGQVFDGPQDNSNTTSCFADTRPVLATTATTGSITLPTTCNGNPVYSANLDVSVIGVNGERSQVTYQFQ